MYTECIYIVYTYSITSTNALQTHYISCIYSEYNTPPFAGVRLTQRQTRDKPQTRPPQPPSNKAPPRPHLVPRGLTATVLIPPPPSLKPYTGWEPKKKNCPQRGKIQTTPTPSLNCTRGESNKDKPPRRDEIHPHRGKLTGRKLHTETHSLSVVLMDVAACPHGRRCVSS